MYFSFDFGWYYRLRTGGFGGLVNGKNPLSVTKVICQQSLRTDTPLLGSDFGISVVRPSKVDNRWVPTISGNLMAEVNHLLKVVLDLRQLNPIHEKGP